MAQREIEKNKSERVRVSPSRYEGHDLIDIRVFAMNRATGEIGPTKKGIALNVDAIPELIDALTWALGQQCAENAAAPERTLTSEAAARLAAAAYETLRAHGTAMHWDSAERMVLESRGEFSKWDLHYVLATRNDLFERTGQGCYRARKNARE